MTTRRRTPRTSSRSDRSPSSAIAMRDRTAERGQPERPEMPPRQRSGTSGQRRRDRQADYAVATSPRPRQICVAATAADERIAEQRAADEQIDRSGARQRGLVLGSTRLVGRRGQSC